jgi:hypothetical protein
MYSVSTDDVLVSPVFAGDLVNWARLDSDDPTVQASLIMATTLATNFLRLNIINRTYTLKYDNWPTLGTNTYPSISRGNLYYKDTIELPYANLDSITSVKVNEVITTDYRVIEGKPYSIEFDDVPVYDESKTALEVVYVAGYGVQPSKVPQPIRDGVLMLAGYIASHRGGCDMGNAIAMSGAGMLLTPYAVRGGIAI